MNAVAREVFGPNIHELMSLQRVRRLEWLRQNPARFEVLKAHYRDGHIDDFINDWGITVDPRNVSKGLPAIMPFTLDPKQREWVKWTFQNWKDGQYGGTEKSRDVGLSWLLVAFTVSMCVLFDNFAGGLGSFKEEKVDKKGDLGSLFEKAREYAEALPVELRAGFSRRRDSPQRLMKFPDTKSMIIGEIGDEIGRGGRTSLYFVDEAAYLDHDEQKVDPALSKNTECRQDVSSVCGMTNTFARRMHDGFSRKFTFHWRDNPRFSQAMYDAFLRQWGPVITAQELDINYTASVEGIICLQVWVQACVDSHLKLKVEPSGMRCAALDIADLGRDLNALCARHGMLVMECVSWSGKDRNVGDTAKKAYQYCDELQLEGIYYDADGGYGSGFRAESDRLDEWRRENFRRPLEIAAFHGSGSVHDPDYVVPGTDVLAKDRFQNAKAQGWWWLAYLFWNTYKALNGQPYDPECLISLSSKISELSKLCIELSQPKWKMSTTGKLMVDKVPDGNQSPNLADAVMMAFAPRALPLKIDPRILDME